MGFQELKNRIEDLIEIEDLDNAINIIDENEILGDDVYSDLQEIDGEADEDLRIKLLKKHELLLYKSNIFERKGMFLEAIILADQVLEECKLLGESAKRIRLRARIAKTIPLVWLGRINESLQVIAETEEQLEETFGTWDKEVEFSKGLLLGAKGLCNMFKGEFATALAHLDNSLKILEILDKQYLVSLVLYYQAFVYSEMGDYSNGIKAFQKILTFSEEKGYTLVFIRNLNMFANLYCEKGDFNIAATHAEKAVRLAREQTNLFLIAFCLRTLGRVYYYKGELSKALEKLQESVELFKETGSKFDSWAIRNIGQVFKAKGDLKLAQEFLNRSLAIYEEIGYKNAIAWNLDFLGDLHREKGDLHKAFTHFQNCLLLREQLGNNSDTSRTLFNLILLSIELNELENAEKYLTRLKQIDRQLEAKTIANRTRLAEALVLLQSARILKKAKAQKILQELIKTENVELTIKIHALLNLCDLFLYELKASENTAIFLDIHSILTELREMAADQSLNPLAVKILLLDAKVSLLEGNIKKSNDILSAAKVLAESGNFYNLVNEIKREQDALNKQLEEWIGLIRRNASMAERIERAQMQDYIEKVKQMVTLYATRHGT